LNYLLIVLSGEGVDLSSGSSIFDRFSPIDISKMEKRISDLTPKAADLLCLGIEGAYVSQEERLKALRSWLGSIVTVYGEQIMRIVQKFY